MSTLDLDSFLNLNLII